MGFVVSLLAIAALMVVLSTLTTAFVEVIHGLIKQRVKGLQQLIGAMFDDLFAREKLASKPDRARFIKEIATNPAAPAVNRDMIIVGNRNAAMLDWLDVRQFVQQLAGSQFGDALEKEAANLEKRLEEIAANFQRYAEGAKLLFKRRAGIYAGIAGVGLAVLMNVDGAQVANSLFRNSQLAEDVVVTFDRKRLLELVNAADPATGDEARIAISKTQVELEGLGLPIGTSYFPYCANVAADAASQADARCGRIEIPADAGSISRFFRNLIGNPTAAIGWLLSVFATGALIGLGAPFWFDFYRKIAAIAPLAGVKDRVAEAIRPSEVVKGEPPAPVAESEKVLTGAELAQIFRMARAR
jgi:hypothetical protein